MTNKNKNNLLAYVLLVFGIITWSFLFLFIKLAANTHTLNVAFLRFFFAFLALLPFYYFIKRREKLKLVSIDFLKIALLVILNGSLVTLFTILATKYSNASISSILVNINPLFIALFAPLLIKEKNKLINYLGIIISFLGVLLIITEGGHILRFLKSEFLLGYVFGLAASLTVGFSVIYLKKYIKKYSTWTITFYTFLLSSVLLFFVNLIFGDFYQLTYLPRITWLWIILMGILSTAFSFIAFNQAVEKVGSAKASVFKLLIPVFVVVIAVLFLNEVVTWYIMAGGVLTLFGLYLAQKK